VGLVVGPKGATIKHIQQQTQTYIVTPSRDKEPVFEVTGMPDNVQSARRQIEAHIALRTGNSSSSNDLNMLSEHMNLSGSEDFLSSPLLSSLYKNGLSSLLEHLELKDQEVQFGQAAQMTSSTGSSTCSSNSSTSSKSASMMIRPELIDLWKTMGNENSIDCDEGISDSPINIWSLPTSSSHVGSRSSPTASASPTDSLLTAGNQSKLKRDCYYCGEKEANALLLPCGHQIFCVECSERVCDANEPCPVCNQKPSQSMKILA
jgi:RNA-binding protein MEX3